MSVPQPNANKLGNVALLAMIVGSIMALGTALSLNNALWMLGNLDEVSGYDTIPVLTLLFGTALFPWVTILSGLFALAFKKSIATIAAISAIVGLTIQLLGTLIGTVMHSMYYWKPTRELFGIGMNTFETEFSTNQILSGLFSKLGVYIAFAAAIIVVIQAIRHRARRAPRVYAPAQVGALFDPMTGAPLTPQTSVAPVANFDPMTGKPIKSGK